MQIVTAAYWNYCNRSKSIPEISFIVDVTKQKTQMKKRLNSSFTHLTRNEKQVNSASWVHFEQKPDKFLHYRQSLRCRNGDIKHWCGLWYIFARRSRNTLLAWLAIVGTKRTTKLLLTKLDEILDVLPVKRSLFDTHLSVFKTSISKAQCIIMIILLQCSIHEQKVDE